MRFLKFKYLIIPVIVFVCSMFIQIPIIDFVKVESSKYMVTDYKKNVKEEILSGVESKVKGTLKENLKPEVIKELRSELMDEVMDNLKEQAIKEIRGDRKWVKSKNSNR